MPTSRLDREQLRRTVAGLWDEAALPLLEQATSIPAESPAFDPQWHSHGALERIVALVRDWAVSLGIPGLRAEVMSLAGRSPLLLLDVPATDPTDGGTVVLYGHLDKQPEGDGWSPGRSPWLAIRDGDRLYGRGTADDGYAVCAFLVAIKALQLCRGGHARCLGLIETSEESGSPDFPAYLHALTDMIGSPSLVVALDAGAGDYVHFWGTTSLRAVVDCTLRVEVLALAHHCGMASGIVPSSFRIIRGLLSRIEDERTGEILPPFLHVPVPSERLAQLADAAAVLEDRVCAPFGFVEGAGPVAHDPFELLVNNTWRPTMAVLAQDGLPPLAGKAHLMRTQTALELSFRFPPGVDVGDAKARLTALLCEHPPYGARVTIDWTSSCNGWNAPPMAPWLAGAVDGAARTHFGTPPRFFGCGGAIPFVNMLGRRYPEAQHLITGVLGPGSNAHGPDEFLHLPTAMRLTACLAEVLHAHSSRREE